MRTLVRVLASFLALTMPIGYARTPYTTWAMGPGGELVRVQDAYSPITEVVLPLNSPQDLALAPDGHLYIADTGNGRIVKLDQNFRIIAELGKGLLRAPTGVFADGRGRVYVADAGSNTVVILESDGRLFRELGRPSEPLFGVGRQFRPRKIAVDARENLYVVSEGSVNGLVVMNTNGNFIGYFGANMAMVSPTMILRRMFLTREQLERLIHIEAASPSNVAIDHQGLVYTITAGTAPQRSISKFNFAGRNLLQELYGSSTFRDIHVDESGLMVAVDAQGRVYEYDINGTLLFVFGAPDRGDQRLGTLAHPTAIKRVGDHLLVLDSEKNAIVVYRATDFATTVHKGVRLYMEGYYVEAKPYFESALAHNGLLIMAYQALADAYYKLGDFANALAHYRYAEDRTGYSNAFWELRNAVLQRHLGGAMLALFSFGVVSKILARRNGWLQRLRCWLKKAQQKRLVDDFLFLFRFIKQPADSYYYIKYNLRGSLAFAFILYAWVVAAHILSLYLTGFVFSPYPNPAWIPVESTLLYTVVGLALWNTANYLVSTITDGEGRLRHVIIGSAYSLFPYALFALPIALVSNVLTLNERFIYYFSSQLMLAWTGLMLFIMVKEIHNFSISETVRNILTTLFAMAMFLLTAYILYVVFNQFYEFIMAIAQEVGLRG